MKTYYFELYNAYIYKVVEYRSEAKTLTQVQPELEKWAKELLNHLGIGSSFYTIGAYTGQEGKTLLEKYKNAYKGITASQLK